MSELPPGLRAAPLARADTAEAVAVWRACERHDDGEALASEADLVAIWQRPSFDPAQRTVAVRDGAAIVALALLHGPRYAFAFVLPAHRGRGIGTWLLGWTHAAGRALGHTVTCQVATEHEHAAHALLRAAGYQPRFASWTFELPLAEEPDPPVVAAGYTLRPFAPGRDDRAVHRVIDDAFFEWPEQARVPFEDWAAERLGRPGFAPEQLVVAAHGDDVAGAALLVPDGDLLWVAQLAVAREHRGRGLARALLVASFEAGRRAGCTRAGLDTDSRTGARGLYERVGMQVVRTDTVYTMPL